MVNNVVEKREMSHPDRKSILPRGRLYEPALQAETAAPLRALLREDMEARAWVKDDEDYPYHPGEPFIVYEPMNKKPEMGVAVLLGKLARFELGQDHEHGLVLIGVPRSATWMAQVIMEAGVFPSAQVAHVTKEPADIPVGASVHESLILSYAHKRKPDNSRAPEVVYFVHPERIAGKDVLLVDDVLAEGETVIGMARVMRDLGANRVDAAVVLSKVLQGGSKNIQESQLVEQLVEGVRVSAVRGPGFRKLVFE